MAENKQRYKKNTDNSKTGKKNNSQNKRKVQEPKVTKSNKLELKEPEVTKPNKLDENKKSIKELVEGIARLEKEAAIYEGEAREPIQYNIDKCKWKLEELLEPFKEQIKSIEEEANKEIARLEKEAAIYEGEAREPIQYNIDKRKWKLEADKKAILDELQELNIDLEAYGFVEQKPKGPKPEGPKPEGSKPEGPKPEGPKPEGPKPEGPKPEGPKPEGPKPTPTPTKENIFIKFLKSIGKLFSFVFKKAPFLLAKGSYKIIKGIKDSKSAKYVSNSKVAQKMRDLAEKIKTEAEVEMTIKSQAESQAENIINSDEIEIGPMGRVLKTKKEERKEFIENMSKTTQKENTQRMLTEEEKEQVRAFAEKYKQQSSEEKVDKILKEEEEKRAEELNNAEKVEGEILTPAEEQEIYGDR